MYRFKIHISHSLYKTSVFLPAWQVISPFTYLIVYIKQFKVNTDGSIETTFTYHIVYIKQRYIYTWHNNNYEFTYHIVYIKL